MRSGFALSWIALVLMSADVRASGDHSNASSCDVQRDALAAVNFVRHHSRQDEYDLKRPNAENWGDEWTVTFARLDHVVPAHGLVAVQKTDCSAAWVPLK